MPMHGNTNNAWKRKPVMEKRGKANPCIETQLCMQMQKPVHRNNKYAWKRKAMRGNANPKP